MRPKIESWVLHWITREPLRRADFFEASTGNCRLRSHLCAKLGETAPTWGKLVAPWAEYVAHRLWNTKPGMASRAPATRLTQQHKREAKGHFELPNVVAPRPQRICRGCGVILRSQKKHCLACGVEICRANMIEIAHRGRIASKSAEARARISAGQRRQRAARKNWHASDLPAWLTRESYREMIWPRLTKITVPNLARTMQVSESYATKVRKGLHVPHPMHWPKLAKLAGISAPGDRS